MLAALALDAFTFVVIGHTRGGPGNRTMPYERYSEMISELRDCEPDFVVLTGDLVYGDFEAEQVDRAAVEMDWDTVDAVFGALGCPIYRVPGNHDVWESTTRDLWTSRYGALQKSFDYGGSRFLLLNSCWLPAPGTDERCPGRFIRGVQFDPERVDFVRQVLDGAERPRHVFAFLGHVTWWDEDAAWWSDVHPLLAAANARAVFSGDLGPWKFSHVASDGINYIQSSVEFTVPPTIMQRNQESIRSLSEQLDNYACVTVDGDDVRIEIKTLGTLTTDRFTPSKYRYVHEYDAGSIARRVFNRMNTPQRLVAWLWKFGLAAFAGGVVAALAAVWVRRRKRA